MSNTEKINKLGDIKRELQNDKQKHINLTNDILEEKKSLANFKTILEKQSIQIENDKMIIKQEFDKIYQENNNLKEKTLLLETQTLELEQKELENEIMEELFKQEQERNKKEIMHTNNILQSFKNDLIKLRDDIKQI